MNDAEKLNLLADWFDVEQDKGRWGSDRKVQEDLRDLAHRILAIGGDVPQQAVSPDANSDAVCPKCGSDLGHYPNCPDGICFMSRR